jgi:hypothetical protein
MESDKKIDERRQSPDDRLLDLLTIFISIHFRTTISQSYSYKAGDECQCRNLEQSAVSNSNKNLAYVKSVWTTLHVIHALSNDDVSRACVALSMLELFIRNWDNCKKQEASR